VSTFEKHLLVCIEWNIAYIPFDMAKCFKYSTAVHINILFPYWGMLREKKKREREREIKNPLQKASNN
jgi:hypothetical protein